MTRAEVKAEVGAGCWSAADEAGCSATEPTNLSLQRRGKSPLAGQPEEMQHSAPGGPRCL